VVFLEAFGLARLAPERPMTTDTVFDLASLTKPFATTVAIMLLVQDGSLDLDQTLGSAISEFSGTDKAEITVRQLLSHTSGLPDYQPYYKELIKLPLSERKASLRRRLIAERLIHAPGQTCLYSDVGFMILEWLVEVSTGRPLDDFVQEAVYGPLGLKHLFFIPFTPTQPLNTVELSQPFRAGIKPLAQTGMTGMTHPSKAVAPGRAGQGGGATAREDRPCVATEDCPWRGKILDGEVHDDNAYAVGGVAGHAGLFGTAQAVYVLLQELFNAYLGKPNAAIFHQDVVQTFFQRQPGPGTWALGFDTPTQPDSSSGKYFSDQSIGHLGFTGTSFWMDLLKDVMVILLTNRIHPNRENERIKAFRPVLHDTVMDSILRQ
jgi:CubicO group peptidase (beta-lactamase class C family)